LSLFLKRGKGHDFRAPESDPNATFETRLLYARLQSEFGGLNEVSMVGANGYGDLTLTPFWTFTAARVEELAGKYPLFISFNWVSVVHPAYPSMVQAIKEHHRRGGICGMTFELWNLVTGGSVYDRDKVDFSAITECHSPSGSKLADYRSIFLDRVAFTLNNDLIDDNGKRIPIIFRFFVETNGWFDFPDVSVTSLTRSGTTATMEFSGTLSVSWNSTSRFQIRGATPSGWNNLWTARSYQILTGTAGGTGTARVTFTVSSSLTTPATGTVTAYLAAGYLWAGSDRAEAVKTLMQQSIEYLRDTKDVHTLLYAFSMYGDNELFSSANPATQPYSQWLTGLEEMADIMTVNWYNNTNPDASTVDIGRQRMRDSMQIFFDWCDEHQKPIMIYEFGAQTAGGSSPDFWTDRCMFRIDEYYGRLAGFTFWSPFWLPFDGTPAVGDFREALSNPRYRWIPDTPT
jgi:hypothetical protein